MNSNNKADGYESSENMTRRELMSAAAAASATILGSGCLDRGNGGTQTIAPPPGHNSTSTETTSSDNETLVDEQETLETSTTTEENTSDTTQTNTASSEDNFQVEDPNYFGWETEDSLNETTGLCYPEEGYLGTLEADEVESALAEEHLYGSDPNNALNDGELIGAVEPLEPVDGAYALDIDARHGDEIQYYVQLVGGQDGGVYLNRQGAYEVSELEWVDVFNEC